MRCHLDFLITWERDKVASPIHYTFSVPNPSAGGNSVAGPASITSAEGVGLTALPNFHTKKLVRSTY